MQQILEKAEYFDNFNLDLYIAVVKAKIELENKQNNQKK
jgi:hypothetical protein